MSACYVTGCTEPGEYRIVLGPGSYCPTGPDGGCDGHDYCGEHTATWRKFGGGMVVSVRSVARKRAAR